MFKNSALFLFKMGIYDDIQGQGIKKEYFDSFCGSIKEGSKIIPPRQYSAIISYLRKQKVINKNNKISLNGLKLFNERLELEQQLGEDIDLSDDDTGSSGGIVPCREEYRSGGGVIPCRSSRR
jgi:hypothetical protein